MNNKTFSIVVGIIIALALAMFVGLYILGLSNKDTATFNDGYEYDNTSSYPSTAELGAEYEDYEYYYESEGGYEDPAYYLDETTGAYDRDDYEFESFDGEYYFAE